MSEELKALQEEIRKYRSHRGRNGPMHVLLDIEEAEAIAATIERLEAEVERLRGALIRIGSVVEVTRSHAEAVEAAFVAALEEGNRPNHRS